MLTALVACVACGGGVDLVTCGDGARLSGRTCVSAMTDAAPGDAPAADARSIDDSSGSTSDGGGRPDAAHLDAHGTLDASGSVDARSVDGRSSSDAPVGTPLTCGDINACIATPSLHGMLTGGPVDMGTFDVCQDMMIPYTCATTPPCGETGVQSEWFTVLLANDCNTVPVLVSVNSTEVAMFDLYVYEVSDPVPQDPPTQCPALIGSATAQVYSASVGPIADVNVTSPGELYIHVVAEPNAMCNTKNQWLLQISL